MMPQIFNNKYKEVIERINAYNLTLLEKITLILEELCETKDKDNDNEYDYGTIARAVIETYETGNTLRRNDEL